RFTQAARVALAELLESPEGGRRVCIALRAQPLLAFARVQRAEPHRSAVARLRRRPGRFPEYDFPEAPPDGLAVPGKFGLERLPVTEAHRVAQAGTVRLVRRQIMSLPVRDCLQPVFREAQEAVGRLKRFRIGFRQQSQPCESRQDRQEVTLAKLLEGA